MRQMAKKAYVYVDILTIHCCTMVLVILLLAVRCRTMALVILVLTSWYRTMAFVILQSHRCFATNDQNVKIII